MGDGSRPTGDDRRIDPFMNILKLLIDALTEAGFTVVK